MTSTGSPQREEVGIGRFALLILAVSAAVDALSLAISLAFGWGTDGWRTFILISCAFISPIGAYLFVRSRYRFDAAEEG